MDRGLGNYYRGNSNARRDDRRYDNFYNRDKRGGGNMRGNRSGGNRGSNRDRGFFDNQSQHNAGQNSVIAALQLQNQNLLSAYIRNQSQSRGNVFPQHSGPRSRGGGFRPGDKRRQESTPSSFHKRSKPSSSTREAERRSSSKGSSSGTSRREVAKKDEPKEEVLPDIPDDQVEVPDNLMDNVEKLRQRKDVERNVADEDIDKLVVFSFNGKGYDCLTCGFMLLKDTAFKNHLMSKSHVMNVIDARSDKKYQQTRELLDIDLTPDGWFEKSEMAKKALIKQAKLLMKIDMEKKKRELENYNRDPSNFFSVNMASKKSATMTGDVVRITSIVESTIDVKEFSKDRFFGCEFVKSVASFQCRLCDIKIHNASEVLPHIDSRVHRNKYQMHLKRVPDYEKKQREQNIELGGILREYEGQPVLLSETCTNTSETPSGQGKTLLEEIDTILVRVPDILNPPPKEEVKDNEKEKAGEDETPKKDEEKAEKQEESEQNVEATGEEEQMETNETDEKTEEGQTEETESKDTEAESQEDKEVDVQEDKAEKVTEEKSEIKEENTEEKRETLETPENTQTEETSKKDEVVSPAPSEVKPKRSAKKGTAVRGRGTAKRGTPKRTRGGRAAASPKVTTTETPTPEKPENEGGEENKEADNDGSFMDGFQIVDEVQEE